MFELTVSVSLLLGSLLGMDAQQSPAFHQPAGPNCQSPPDGASQEVIDCFDEACEVYRKAWNDCETPACKTQATTVYIAAINQCDPEYRIGPGDWACFWYAGDSFGVAFDGEILPENATLFAF
jgi:hypothetical protein